MNSPNPVPTPSWAPSGSTHASAVGGALAIVFTAIVTQNHWLVIDPVTAAAFATLFSAGLGYLPSSGRL
jgi:hypothetical protein